MISIRLQIFVALSIFLMAAAIIRMVSKKKIDLPYAIGWLLLLLLGLFIDIFPGILYRLSAFIGVRLPVNMIFMVSLFMLIMAAYLLTAAVSRNVERTKRLTQEIALLQREIDVLKDNNETMAAKLCLIEREQSECTTKKGQTVPE